MVVFSGEGVIEVGVVSGGDGLDDKGRVFLSVERGSEGRSVKRRAMGEQMSLFRDEGCE